jgi:hypothetical protein
MLGWNQLSNVRANPGNEETYGNRYDGRKEPEDKFGKYLQRRSRVHSILGQIRVIHRGFISSFL